MSSIGYPQTCHLLPFLFNSRCIELMDVGEGQLLFVRVMWVGLICQVSVDSLKYSEHPTVISLVFPFPVIRWLSNSATHVDKSTIYYFLSFNLFIPPNRSVWLPKYLFLSSFYPSVIPTTHPKGLFFSSFYLPKIDHTDSPNGYSFHLCIHQESIERTPLECVLYLPRTDHIDPLCIYSFHDFIHQEPVI